MALHHAVVVESSRGVETAKAFTGPGLAEAFAHGVEAGATAASAGGTRIRSLLMDGRGSLAVSNKGLAAAREAGWEPQKEDEAAGPAGDPMDPEQLVDLLETAWGVIANACGGNWKFESKDWQAAAARFRDRYHAVLDARRSRATS